MIALLAVTVLAVEPPPDAVDVCLQAVTKQAKQCQRVQGLVAADASDSAARICSTGHRDAMRACLEGNGIAVSADLLSAWEEQDRFIDDFSLCSAKVVADGRACVESGLGMIRCKAEGDAAMAACGKRLQADESAASEQADKELREARAALRRAKGKAGKSKSR